MVFQFQIYSPTSLSGYAQHFCAVDNDTAHCWGKDVGVTEKPDVAYVAAGNGFSCGVLSGRGNTECWDLAGNELIGHYTDNPQGIYAGDDLVCVLGSFQDSSFLNCWKPSWSILHNKCSYRIHAQYRWGQRFAKLTATG